MWKTINKVKDPVQSQDQSQMPRKEKKKKEHYENYKSSTKKPSGRMLSGVDNWLPALLLPLLPVLSRPCTCWMGRMLLSVLCWTHWRKNTPIDVIGAVFQINSLLGHVTLGCAIVLPGGNMDAVHNWSQYTHWTWHCTSSSDLLEYHTTCRYLTSLDVHAMGHVALLTRAVSLDPLKQAWCSTSSDLTEC